MILKTFYSGAIESVLTQCISVWYGYSLNQDCKALQRVVRLAERISGSVLSSLQDIYIKGCKSRAAKIIKDSNHPDNHLFCLLPSDKRFRSMMAKTARLRRSFFPSGHQAPKLKHQTWSHNINISPFNISNIIIILHHPYFCYVYIPGTTYLHIPLAHPCLNYYLLQYTVLHILFYCTTWSSLWCFFFFFFFYLYFCLFSCVVLQYFALSIERTWPDLHFTTDYILYNWVCDE